MMEGKTPILLSSSLSLSLPPFYYRHMTVFEEPAPCSSRRA